jgi:hypothetical protein
MAVYEFGSQFTFNNVPRVDGFTQPNPHIDLHPPGLSQSSHVEGGRTPLAWEEHRAESSDLEDFIGRGFRYLDGAMKNYWADIRIPTKDSSRFVRTKIAGMQKSLEIWTEDLKHGRVKLPVISISRTGQEFNPNKFTPPYEPVAKRYVNTARSMVALTYRPTPYIVNYILSIWTETKRDAEYILPQILTRFNSLAELTVSDEHIVGNVQMLFKGSTDNSDKEAVAEQHAKIKYEVAYAAEAWLSLPRKVMPTILGHVYTTELT